MKFARLLRATAFEGMPQMETLFSAYKALKKKIKKLPHKEQLGQQQANPSDALTEEETEFVQALSDTLNQLNDIYIEKEETSVIRVERLESELSTATTAEQLNELHKQFVDFHGEVLLLVHWSILAYTATVKILKKHHKRTGLLVKAPQLGNLLSQPFCSTELMTSIARRVEEDIQRLSERMGLPTQRASEPSLQQVLRQPAAQQGSEPVGTPSTTGAAAMAAAAALAAAAAATCSDNACAVPPVLAAAAAAAPSGIGGAAGAAGGVVTAPAAAAAATAAAGQEMPEHGLDLQLLRQLAADSGSQTSRSDDGSAEQDTCASKQQQPCSQQANLQQPAGAEDDHQEIQSAPKRRRGNHTEPSAAAAAAGAPLAGGDGATAGAAAAADQPSGVPVAQQWQQEGIASPAAAAAAADVMLSHMCPSAAEHRASFTGNTPPQQQSPGRRHHQQQQPAGAQDQALADGAQAGAVASAAAASQQQGLMGGAGYESEQDGVGGDDAAGGSCAREASIMRQTQVALTTWRHLQSTASTPSTVMQGTGQPTYTASETAVTASSAVQ